ncbi:hypothetical protein JQV27_13175 [Sulfitobacter mediterraneus]|jgi:hypothetical protein|uniref:hypothetical protein n=1 Tax=Sulfitobacter mediterraneus TaxID=83219 RepID=UPI0019330A93|nr:hypothetical protein [Sulfitobacter mediterraneus]MBM1633898.1 hypothetical protein [Sulfitobacter mediterraneus]MBM1641587.1 hypothetical protein [Sulfitobacter mediterraneus]MBM1645762.1 hypothetical protein [Sulfitobacter mediterraneus]MBM1649706.1 hypothetical protein [Sulfitobacter mediterraneus]MBM1653831.1 hypothetical protein [Sulfitobacter mediterraneus]
MTALICIVLVKDTQEISNRALKWATTTKKAFSSMGHEKKPLYRKVNTRTYGVRHGDGGKAKWERGTKKADRDQSMLGTMHKKHRHGLDYTPLFKFLLSKVGQNWDEVHSEAVSRLDNDEPISWLVSETKEEGRPFVRTGESSYFSGLYVDDDNRLALVDPDLTANSMKPFCSCCTHTLNGQRLTQGFSPSK